MTITRSKNPGRVPSFPPRAPAGDDVPGETNMRRSRPRMSHGTSHYRTYPIRTAPMTSANHLTESTS